MQKVEGSSPFSRLEHELPPSGAFPPLPALWCRPVRRLVCLLAAATCLLAAPGGAQAARCKAGLTHVSGSLARRFCGPAGATLQGASTITLKGGSCERRSTYLAVNIGTVVLGVVPNSKLPDYFGLLVGKTLAGGVPATHDGTYTTSVTVAFDYQHHRFVVLRPTVTLTNNRTRGTFSGRVLGSTATLTGTFHC